MPFCPNSPNFFPSLVTPRKGVYTTMLYGWGLFVLYLVENVSFALLNSKPTF
jgi:hypothetical protein